MWLTGTAVIPQYHVRRTLADSVRTAAGYSNIEVAVIVEVGQRITMSIRAPSVGDQRPGGVMKRAVLIDQQIGVQLVPTDENVVPAIVIKIRDGQRKRLGNDGGTQQPGSVLHVDSGDRSGIGGVTRIECATQASYRLIEREGKPSLPGCYRFPAAGRQQCDRPEKHKHAPYEKALFQCHRVTFPKSVLAPEVRAAAPVPNGRRRPYLMD